MENQKNILKVTGFGDVPFAYVIKEMTDVKASHLPLQGFSINNKYPYENERRYHADPSLQALCLRYAQELDVAYYLTDNFPSNGAPIVDMRHNVLGGNCRFMSLAYASEKFANRYQKYCQAIAGIAWQYKLNITGIKKPVLLRQIDVPQKKCVILISALNESSTASRDVRCDALSRGTRLSKKSIKILIDVLENFDSFRQAMDSPSSLPFIDSIIEDGVILPQEGSRFLQGGYLNPDGKNLVEKGLLSLIIDSYETISKIPEPIMAKILASMPSILTVKKDVQWNIQDDLKAALNILSEYVKSNVKTDKEFLNKSNLFTGKSVLTDFSELQVKLFLILKNFLKQECVSCFKKYAGAYEKANSPMAGLLGINITAIEAQKRAFMVEIPKIQINQKQITSLNNLEAGCPVVENSDVKKPSTRKNDCNNMEAGCPVDNSDIKPIMDKMLDVKKPSTRKTKNDCDKQNSMLIASYTGKELQDALPIFFEKIGEFELQANSKTQYKVIDIDNRITDYRVIKTGRQWQLRKLNTIDVKNCLQDALKDDVVLEHDNPETGYLVDALPCKQETGCHVDSLPCIEHINFDKQANTGVMLDVKKPSTRKNDCNNMEAGCPVDNSDIKPIMDKMLDVQITHFTLIQVIKFLPYGYFMAHILVYAHLYYPYETIRQIPQGKHDKRIYAHKTGYFMRFINIAKDICLYARPPPSIYGLFMCIFFNLYI